MENYEKALLLYNKLTLFGGYFENNSSRSSGDERKAITKKINQNLELNSDCKIHLILRHLVFEKKKTLVIADLHRLLLYIRETKQNSSDIVISSKMGNIKSNPNILPIKVKTHHFTNVVLRFLEEWLG